MKRTHVPLSERWRLEARAQKAERALINAAIKVRKDYDHRESCEWIDKNECAYCRCLDSIDRLLEARKALKKARR